jgi:hypothetical protein
MQAIGCISYIHVGCMNAAYMDVGNMRVGIPEFAFAAFTYK